jgi:hypothetical protein
MPANWTCPDTGKTFLTGASASPRHALLGAIPYIPLFAPPAQVAYVPKKRSMFGNDSYGDCVTAEEAFAKSCDSPEHDIDDQVVISWARQHGLLHGADLSNVLELMARKGFQQGEQLYNDGPASGVDFSNEVILQSAIAQGPVKIAIAASALPGGAGSRDGWYQLGSRNRNTDHAVALCGYGPAGWLYQQLGVQLPSALQPSLPGYLLYTWSTIGFVDHAWIMGTTDEAWVRSPTTIGVPPLPLPPLPPQPPGPNPLPVGIEVVISGPVPPGKYILFPKVNV